MEGGANVAKDKDYTNTSFLKNWYWSDVRPTSCCNWPSGLDWDGWHNKGGQDQGSIVNLDPMFVDLSSGNYELRPESEVPARIGWESISYKDIGPQLPIPASSLGASGPAILV